MPIASNMFKIPKTSSTEFSFNREFSKWGALRRVQKGDDKRDSDTKRSHILTYTKENGLSSMTQFHKIVQGDSSSIEQKFGANFHVKL